MPYTDFLKITPYILLMWFWDCPLHFQELCNLQFSLTKVAYQCTLYCSVHKHECTLFGWFRAYEGCVGILRYWLLDCFSAPISDWLKCFKCSCFWLAKVFLKLLFLISWNVFSAYGSDWLNKLHVHVCRCNFKSSSSHFVSGRTVHAQY